MTTDDGGGYADLVDLAAGTVVLAAFTGPGVFAAEQQRLFARAWPFLGHESQIPEPEDFVTSRMGGWRGVVRAAGLRLDGG